MKSTVPLALLIGALLAGIAGGVFGADLFGSGDGPSLATLKATVAEQSRALDALGTAPGDDAVIPDAPSGTAGTRLVELERTVTTLQRRVDRRVGVLARFEALEQQLDAVRRDLADTQAALAARSTAPSTTPAAVPAAGAGLDAAVERVIKARETRKLQAQLDAQIESQRNYQTQAAERLTKALIKRLNLDAGQREAVARVLQTRADRTIDALTDYYRAMPQYRATAGASASADFKQAQQTYQQAVKAAAATAVADIRQQLSSSQLETFDQAVKQRGGLDAMGYQQQKRSSRSFRGGDDGSGYGPGRPRSAGGSSGRFEGRLGGGGTQSERRHR